MDHRGQLAFLRSNNTLLVCWCVDCTENFLPHWTREVWQLPWSNYHYGIQHSYLDVSPKVWFGLPKASFGAGPFLLLLFLDHSSDPVYLRSLKLCLSQMCHYSQWVCWQDETDIHSADYIWLFLDITFTDRFIWARLLLYLYLFICSVVFTICALAVAQIKQQEYLGEL